MPRCLGLPCSAQQALALYRHLFGCPASLGQLQAALQQVPESRAFPPGLELPVMLLDMEQNRRVQEQLLWDLELLTGAGLGLFWPPRAQSYGLWGRGVRSWWDKPHGSTVGGSEQLSGSSGLHPSPQAVDSLSLGCLFPKGHQHTDEGEAASDTRRASRLAVPTPGPFPELKTGSCGISGEPGGSKLTDLTRREDSGEARVVTQGAPGSSDLLEPPGPGWVLYRDRGRELAELEKLLRIEGPQRQEEEAQPRAPEEETPERGEVSVGQSGEAPRVESPRTGALSEPRGATPQGQESLSSGGRNSQAQEEGNILDPPRHADSSLEERIPQPGERGSPGPQGRTTPPLLQGQEPGPAQEGAGGPHPALCPGAATPAACTARDSGLREGPAAPPGVQESAGSPEREEGGEAGAPEAPRAPRAAWARVPGVSAAQQESALQRLLELHRAARRRRGREREQQRLRVLEGLRIARNRRCRVHPLGPPLQQVQFPLQDDSAGQRRALREQLQQVYRERTGRLRTQGARNTQNFQQLLYPSSTSEPELLDPQKEMGALHKKN